MGDLRVLFPCGMVLLGASLLSCGANRSLQSVTITPAAADAKNYANGSLMERKSSL